MLDLSPLNVLPVEFQREWQATLHKAEPTEKGVFRLVKIRKTQPKTFEELRIIVLVVDENGFPMPGVKVAFSYSTANQYLVGEDFKWVPPSPHRADIFPTTGGGQIEHIQGSVIKQGEPGGITAYVVEPEYSSDYVSGAGALADHTGMHMTFQLRRTGVTPLGDRIKSLEERVAALEAKSGS